MKHNKEKLTKISYVSEKQHRPCGASSNDFFQEMLQIQFLKLSFCFYIRAIISNIEKFYRPEKHDCKLHLSCKQPVFNF